LRSNILQREFFWHPKDLRLPRGRSEMWLWLCRRLWSNAMCWLWGWIRHKERMKENLSISTTTVSNSKFRICEGFWIGFQYFDVICDEEFNFEIKILKSAIKVGFPLKFERRFKIEILPKNTIWWRVIKNECKNRLQHQK
jgi:hypothetical protein